MISLPQHIHIDFTRLLNWAPVAVALGIFFYFIAPWQGILVGFSFLLVIAFFLEPLRTLIFSLWVFLALGILFSFIRCSLIEHDVLERPLWRTSIRGTLEEIEETPKGTRVVIALNHFVMANDDTPLNLKRVRLFLRQHIPPSAQGHHIKVMASLMPFSSPLFPGGYDFRFHGYFQGVGATGYSLSPPVLTPPTKNPLLHSPLSWLHTGMHTWRNKLTQKIYASLPGDTGAIAASLVTGARRGISQSTNEAFNHSGLAHILSISGFHFSLLASILFFCLRRLTLPLTLLFPGLNGKKMAAWLVLIVSLLYCGLAGSTVPVVRSFLMISGVMAAIILDREPFSMRLVSLAALIILAITPESIFSISFQLSFAAVIALVAFFETPALMSWCRNRGFGGKIFLYGTSAVVTTAIASIATAPLTLIYFQQFSLYSIAANVLATPVAGLVIMPCVALVLLIPINVIPDILMELLGWGVDQLIAVSVLVSSWPGSVVVMPPFSPLLKWLYMSLFFISGLWLCLSQGRHRWWGVLGLIGSQFVLPLLSHPEAVFSQRPVCAMIRDGKNSARLIGKVSPFTRDIWKKYLGVTTIEKTHQGLAPDINWPKKNYSAAQWGDGTQRKIIYGGRIEWLKIKN